MENSNFDDFNAHLVDLRKEVKEKAIEIAQQLVEDKMMSKEAALKEGIKQAEEWFMDLEG